MMVKRIIAGVIAFTLIGFIIYVANAFMGNPVSRMIVDQAAKKYVEQNYDDLNLELEKATFNFKDGNYHIHAKSKTRIDTHFYLYFSGTGQYMYDDYESSVLEKFNTWERIDTEYRDLVDTFVLNDLPFESDIAFGEIPDEGRAFTNLEIDQYYDINEMGKEKGHIIIYITSDQITEEKLMTTLLKIKDLFDDQQIPFHSIDLALQEPLSDKNDERKDIMITDFLYRDINEDGLQEKVNENIEKTREYYDEMDTKTEVDIDDIDRS